MTTIVTRAAKGSPLTNTEVDSNFTNLNTGKAELSGAVFTGAITTNSTIDGRDVATDGTKLDGVEASADVTDTANVTAAGALMDSELTAIASVKALNQGVATDDSPTFAAVTSTGEIVANGGIALGDNDKATFGVSDDLQIYHDGSHSYVGDYGTGNLSVTGNNLYLQNTAGETYFSGISDGAVSLYHNNLAKLATTSTGIDVTGNYVNSGHLLHNNNSGLKIIGGGDATNAGSNLTLYGGSNASAGTFRFRNGTATHLEVAGNGDISFYEDTGTTAKLFWDASAESLGIGTSSPTSYYTGADNLVIHQASGEAGMTIATASDTSGALYFADGTSGDAEYRGGIAYNHSTDVLSLVSGGANRATIDSSGTITSTKAGGVFLQNSSGGTSATQAMISNTGGSMRAGVESSTGGTIQVGTSAYAAVFGNQGNYPTQFTTNGTTRMTIDSSGNVLVGKSSDANTANGVTLRPDGGGRFTAAGTSSFVQLAFFRNGSASEVGSILTTSSATTYATSSDYRLKENVVPMTGSIDRVKALKPSRFNFIVDADKTVDGFLAHEAQTVVPECVTGTKDAMKDEEYEVTAAVEEVRDADNNITTEAVEAVTGTRNVPDMQGIDQAKLVPLLTAALQEAITKIESLTARIEALEA